MKKFLKGCLALAGLGLCLKALFVPTTNIVTFGWLGDSVMAGAAGAAALKIAAPWNNGRGTKKHA